MSMCFHERNKKNKLIIIAVYGDDLNFIWTLEELTKKLII